LGFGLKAPYLAVVSYLVDTPVIIVEQWALDMPELYLGLKHLGELQDPS
jgi:hypothetical protein